MGETSKRTYRIVKVADLQPGDIIRTTNARVETIELDTPMHGHVALSFTNRAHGVVRGCRRVGIYR